jgi:hypothetical protein
MEQQPGGTSPQIAPSDEDAEFRRAIELARASDVAVLVLGEAAYMSG